MTGRQEYDRTKDRQRILGKYMIDGELRSVITCFKSLVLMPSKSQLDFDSKVFYNFTKRIYENLFEEAHSFIFFCRHGSKTKLIFVFGPAVFSALIIFKNYCCLIREN